MPRPYPDHRRRRPGRRPPNRYNGGAAPRPARHGFTGPGLLATYDKFLPLRGRQKRSYFNRAAAVLALAAGCGGAALGCG